MKISLLTIGNEILRGAIINSNAAWISTQCEMHNHQIIEHRSVLDDLNEMENAIKSLMKKSDLVILTGGLGPTEDDITRDGAALACDKELVFDEKVMEELREFFKKNHRKFSETNRRQAYFPAGSTILSNPVGSASGFWMKHEDTFLFSFPGVPREMKSMVKKHLLPFLKEHQEGYRAIRRFHVFGISESLLAEKIEAIKNIDVEVGYRPHFPEIEVFIKAISDSIEKAKSLVDEASNVLLKEVPEFVYGEGEILFPEAIGKLFRDKKKTLAIAESCTGGLVSSLLTAKEGASQFLLLDVVSYSNQAKMDLLGVLSTTLETQGAVSEACAKEMVEGVLREGKSDLAISVTGLAGPSGASKDKPIGMVCFGIAERGKPTQTLTKYFGANRVKNQYLAAYSALDLLRRRLNEMKN